MKKMKKMKIEVSGRSGNYLIRRFNTVSFYKGKTKKERNELQSAIDLKCDMISEYLTDEILNDEHFQLLDIDLERFLSDDDYYFEVFDNKRGEYDMIIGWFDKELCKYWNDIFDFMLKRGLTDRLYNVTETLFNKYYDEIDFKPLTNEDMDEINQFVKLVSYLESNYSKIGVRKVLDYKNKIGWNTKEDNLLNQKREVA